MLTQTENTIHYYTTVIVTNQMICNPHKKEGPTCCFYQILICLLGGLICGGGFGWDIDCDLTVRQGLLQGGDACGSDFGLSQIEIL